MVYPENRAVVVIGAGPYGLSIAAHLRSQGVNFRIFGTPMHRWLEHMPKGMFLKSEGCASNLFDPMNGYTLKQYCTTRAAYAQYVRRYQSRLLRSTDYPSSDGWSPRSRM